MLISKSKAKQLIQSVKNANSVGLQSLNQMRNSKAPRSAHRREQKVAYQIGSSRIFSFTVPHCRVVLSSVKDCSLHDPLSSCAWLSLTSLIVGRHRVVIDGLRVCASEVCRVVAVAFVRRCIRHNLVLRNIVELYETVFLFVFVVGTSTKNRRRLNLFTTTPVRGVSFFVNVCICNYFAAPFRFGPFGVYARADVKNYHQLVSEDVCKMCKFLHLAMHSRIKKCNKPLEPILEHQSNVVGDVYKKNHVK